MPRAFNPLTSPINAGTPGVVTLTDPNPAARWTPSLNDSTSYILNTPTKRTRPITINGGHHVNVRTWIELSAGGLSEMLSIKGGAPGRCITLDRCLLDGNGNEADGIKTASFATCLQLSNVHMIVTGHTAGVHADFVQSSGGLGELWAENFTGYTDYDGFMMQREANVENTNTAWTITNAVRTSATVVFTATGHGLAVGDPVGVSGVTNTGTDSPDGYNGGFTVTARTTNTFTVTLGDLRPGTFSGNGICQLMTFAYDVGDVRFNRVNVHGLPNGSGAPSEALQMYRIGARSAPAPNASSINNQPFTRQNEDKTPLTYEWWNGEFEATDTYGNPNSGNIDQFVEPDGNAYSVIAPVLDTAPTPDQITYPTHPNVKAGTIVKFGNPPGGDYCTQAQALDWSGSLSATAGSVRIADQTAVLSLSGIPKPPVNPTGRVWTPRS